MLSRTFAAHKHAAIGQFYGEQDYVVHLDEVVEILRSFGFKKAPIANFVELVFDTGYLHDVIEDTSETLDSLSEEFHIYVAKAVQNLSDVEAPTRKERKRLTNEKFITFSVDIIDELIALIVKPADRLANMRQSFSDKSRMMKVYYKEYPDFREAAYREGVIDDVWKELDILYVQIKEDYEYI